MLNLVTSSTLAGLAKHLADILGSPLDDPLATDWVAVPNAGTTRWLRLELARHLGASSVIGDGVAANIEMPFPGALARAALDGALRQQLGLGPHDRPFDPWRLDHLVWSVLDVIDTGAADPMLRSLTHLPDGATRFGQARRVADLFDRYAVHRPSMLLAWARGRDIDAQGASLHASYAWQPHLWRLVRTRIGTPSPPERLPQILESLHAGTLPLALPPRLAVFGLSVLPGGRSFIDVARAVAAHRDVHLLLIDPSPGTSAHVRPRALAQAAERGPDAGPLLRAEDTTAAAVRHPLAAAWTHSRRETTVLLAEAEARREISASQPVPSAELPDAGSLLARVQADLRADEPPAQTFVPRPDDRSVQIHLCHGPARQLEIVRDAILHLLAEDPTLREDDIVILSPDVARFSPLVEAAFGPPADSDAAAAHYGPPLLRWRVTDRSLRSAHPMLDALAALLELIGGRFEASKVLDLCALAPTRRRWGFDDDALDRIRTWVDATGLRWGLDADHRTRWGLPPDHESNTWRSALDQLLMGIAIADDEPTFGPGAVVAHGVEGSDVGTLGSLADLIARLGALSERASVLRPAGSWAELLADAADELFEVDRRDDWQRARLREVLASITERAQTVDGPSTVPLGLADVRRLLADELAGRPARAGFLDGGLTISSLQPLRGVPHRVVCLIGLDDQGGAAASGLLGDDLIATQAIIGDRDARADERQALLEAVLAAGDHLIVTRNGHDVRTNQPLPAAVALAELRDTIVATLRADVAADAMLRIERTHARQPFDEAELLPSEQDDRTWSFDPRSLAGAQAKRGRLPAGAPRRNLLAPHETEVVTLAELHDFLAHPVRAFYRSRLGVVIAEREEPTTDQLPVSLTPLEAWALGAQLLRTRTLGHDEERWLAIESARGTLPAGVLGANDLRSVHDEVAMLLDAAAEHPGSLRAIERHDVDVTVDRVEAPGSVRLVGTVGRCRSGPTPGPTELTYSRSGPKLVLRLWLDLLALTAAHPTVEWKAVGIARGKSGKPLSKPPIVTEMRIKGATPSARATEASTALCVVADLYRRGFREPLPLFPVTSYTLASGTSAGSAWGGNDRGEAANPYNRQAFPATSLDDLTTMDALPDDPPGADEGRALRYATVLWGAVAQSTEVEGDEETDAALSTVGQDR